MRIEEFLEDCGINKLQKDSFRRNLSDPEFNNLLEEFIRTFSDELIGHDDIRIQVVAAVVKTELKRLCGTREIRRVNLDPIVVTAIQPALKHNRQLRKKEDRR